MNFNPHPYVMLLLGILSVSSSAIFIKFAGAPPMTTAFYRMLFTVLFLTPFILRKHFTSGLFAQLHGRQLLLTIMAGIFLAFHFAFWITSLNYTSITSSTVLVSLQPLFVMVGSYFFYGETVGYRALAGAVITIGGGVVLGLGDISSGSDALFGDLLALGGALFVACYLLIGRKVRKTMDALPYTYVVYLTAALVLVGGNALVTQEELTGYPPETFGWFAAMALFPNLFGHSVFSWALKYVKAAVISVSILGEPVGATILTFLIWGIVPGFLQIAGGILILAGLAIFIWYIENRK